MLRSPSPPLICKRVLQQFVWRPHLVYLRACYAYINASVARDNICCWFVNISYNSYLNLFVGKLTIMIISYLNIFWEIIFAFRTNGTFVCVLHTGSNNQCDYPVLQCSLQYLSPNNVLYLMLFPNKIFFVACISCLLYFTIVHRFENQLVYFKGTGLPEKKNYEVTIPLYGEIIPEECVKHNIGRCIEVLLVKVSRFYKLLSP